MQHARRGEGYRRGEGHGEEGEDAVETNAEPFNSRDSVGIQEGDLGVDFFIRLPRDDKAQMNWNELE